MDSFTISNILSILSLFIVTIFGALFSLLLKRAFKNIDESINTTNQKIEKLSKYGFRINSTEKDIIRLQENQKPQEKLLVECKQKIEDLEKDLHDKFISKEEFIRETNYISNQIVMVLKSIDQINEKIDKD